MAGSTVTAPVAGRGDTPAGVEKLVVPLDGSALAETALAVAAALARRLGAAVQPFGVVGRAVDVEARRAELAAFARGPADVASGPAPTVVASDDPAGALLGALAGEPAAVACMSSHGLGTSAALVGSVARTVLARAGRPLIVTCPLVDQQVGHGVVVAVDGGPSSAGLIGAAVGWAGLLGDDAEVVAVSGTRRHGPRGRADELRERLEALAGTAAGGPGGPRTPTVRVRMVDDPVGPASALCRLLRAEPARLVVVGTRCHAGLPWLPLGREAASLIRHSPSPVLVVPAGTG